MHMRLAQKVTLAVLVACVPIVLLGLWVASFAANLVKTEVNENIGLSGQVESERVSFALGRAESILLEIGGREAFVRNVNQLIGNSANELSAREQLQAEIINAQSDNAERGLVSIAVFVFGNLEASAGEMDPAVEGSWSKVGPDDLRLTDRAFALDNGTVHVPILRYIATTEGIEQSDVGVVIVSEWDVDQLIASVSGRTTQERGLQTFLLQPNPDGSLLVVGGSNLNELGRIKSLEVNPEIDSAPIVKETIADDGDEVVQASARVKTEAGWVSVLEVDRAVAYADLDSVRLRLITVFIAAAMVIVLVVVLAFRSFARRLGRMTDLAESVASGDLTVRTGDPRRDELGRLSYAFDEMTQALAEDIARRERMEAQLEYQASHDALTGLPNRAHLVQELDQMLVNEGELISVLFVDLDGFKAVNDRLGHGAGDELLVRVGERLRDVLRPSDFLARLGGDEFTIVLRGLGIMESERLAGRVVAALELPFIVADEEVSISASIGVAAASSERSTETLIKQADVAMYRAKAQGKGRAVRVTPETLAEVDDRVSILAELREATANGELQMMFWPTGDLRDGSLRGMEATVRWNHPERGVITPADFLPLAINSGFATQIDEWVIANSTAMFARWQKAGLPVRDLQMSINLVPEMFLKSRSRQLMTQEINRHGLKASNFRIEVPEVVLRTGSDALKDVFDTYRALGVPVTLDRFGSDYSNLDLLPRFAIDSVKIDLHLISDLTNRLSSRALVGSLITLAQTAGLRVAAAGVDDESTRDQLIELGCHQGQGLWLAPALEEDALIEMLESRHLLELG